MEASGNLKRCRGKILPVKVKPTANAQCSLAKGVTKHVNHDKKVHEGLEYVLPYPVHSEVINSPGTTEEFVLPSPHPLSPTQTSQHELAWSTMVLLEDEKKQVGNFT